MNFAHQIQYPDKRKERRHQCAAVVEFSFFNKEKYFDAKLFNFSKSGVYIETAHDLKPGCTILLKMIKYASSRFNSLDHERPRSVSLGEVKWRSDLSKRDKAYYGVGVKYPFSDLGS
jgi:hypothetical protein